MVLAALSLIGMILWLCADYFKVAFAELAGDVLSSEDFSGASLIHKTISNNAILGLVMIVMLIVAPIVQAVVALLPDRLAPQHMASLQKLGDAAILCDVFFGGFLAVLRDVDGIANWILTDRFGGPCDAAEELLGAGCIGLRTTPMAVGFIGLVLAVIGSLGLILMHIVSDLRESARSATPQEPCLGDTFMDATSGTLALGERSSEA